MNDGFTRIETALLEALERERAALHQRDLIHGVALHEIANAVTVVASGLELIKHNTPDSSTHAFALQQIHRGVNVMSDLIRGLRVLLESTAEPAVFSRADLFAFVRSVVTDPHLVGNGAIGRVGVVLRGGEATTSFCPVLLRHALSQLVRNALKYSAPQTPVTVSVGARGGRRWIHVINRGPKLGAEVVRHLFVPRKRSPGGGVGFGLHITQACTLRMGGRVVYGSTPNATVFSLILPGDFLEAPAGADASARTLGPEAPVRR
ncbi:MAG: sensor histidine kinase [Verrucomicrobia bacterium]|jgi:signal transduction histidine kinase|nr:sensor histidine kinase [Verrucomicrobiota bacterium]